MFGSTTVRWLGAVWLLLMGVGHVAVTYLIPFADWLPEAGSKAGQQLVKQYNSISHIIFLIGLTSACAGLIWAAQHPDQSNSESAKTAGSKHWMK